MVGRGITLGIFPTGRVRTVPARDDGGRWAMDVNKSPSNPDELSTGVVGERSIKNLGYKFGASAGGFEFSIVR